MKIKANIKACLLTVLLIAVCGGVFSQPLPPGIPMPPPTPVPPFSTVPAPYLPVLPDIQKEEIQLVREYRELDLERKPLYESIKVQSKKVAQSKKSLRETTNPVKKWMVRRDFQDEVNKLRGSLNRLNQIEKRMQEIRKIAVEKDITLPDKPDDKQKPSLYRPPIMMRQHGFEHPPQMPMGPRFSNMTSDTRSFKGKGKGNNSPQKRLERLRKQQEELDKRSQQTQEEINQLERDNDSEP